MREIDEIERCSQAELNIMFKTVGQAERLALFDMDGTLLKGRFVVNLAQRTNKVGDLNELLDRDDIPADDRTQRIAALFGGIPKEVFEEVARSSPTDAWSSRVGYWFAQVRISRGRRERQLLCGH